MPLPISLKKRAFMKWILACGLVACVFLLGLFPTSPVSAQVVSNTSGTFSATGTTPWLRLDGASQCAVVLSGTGAGMAITVQGANDVPPTTAITVTTIGTSGALSANGTASGGVAAYALTGIRLNVTAISGGTEAWQITCSVSVSGGSGGPWSTVATSNPTSTPLPVKTSAGVLYGAQVYNGSAATIYIGIYNALVAGVTLGTTMPAKLIAVPATTYAFLPVPAGGVSFGTGISYMCGSALTGGVPTTGCGSQTTTWLSIDFQ